MKKKLLLFILFILVGCSTLPQEEGKVWVEKHLTQCAEEWQEWVYTNYTHESRDQGIVAFYANKGIVIFDIQRTEVEMGIVCEACTCPSNTKLYLQISEEDKDYFLSQGYE